MAVPGASIDLLRLGGEGKPGPATGGDAAGGAEPGFEALLSSLGIVPAAPTVPGSETTEIDQPIAAPLDEKAEDTEDPIAAIALALPEGVLPPQVKAPEQAPVAVSVPVATALQVPAQAAAPTIPVPVETDADGAGPIVDIALPAEDAGEAPVSAALLKRVAEVIGGQADRPSRPASTDGQRAAPAQPVPPRAAAPVVAQAIQPGEAQTPKGKSAPVQSAPAAELPSPPPAPAPAVSAAPAYDPAIRVEPALVPAANPAAASADIAGRLGEQAVQARLDIANESAWMDRVARDIAQLGGGDGRLKFQLNPENLGSLQIEVSQGADGVSLRFSTETEGARAVIADAQHRLASEARAQGLRIAETHIDFGNHNNGSGQKAPQSQQPRIITQGQAQGAGPADMPRSKPLDRFA